MKREIKFRGKNTNNGKWVYAELHALGMDLFNECVNEDTIGQFTGLRDKNGTEIYEGDIVRMSYVAEICTDDDCYEEEGKYVGVAAITANKGACLNPCVKNGLYNTKYKPLSAYRSEVIGNIYDTPELLKGEKQ